MLKKGLKNQKTQSKPKSKPKWKMGPQTQSGYEEENPIRPYVDAVCAVLCFVVIRGDGHDVVDVCAVDPSSTIPQTPSMHPVYVRREVK
ncbi:MAG: hypothetical protein CL912_07435 [Deltaproteobacteria bacterium]|nr:hypothetical protein [Deltaproteobacteria bacterium]